jgi:hypothetical protein
MAASCSLLVDREGLMPESVTEKKTPLIAARVAGFKSVWWPVSCRNGGRLQIG